MKWQLAVTGVDLEYIQRATEYINLDGWNIRTVVEQARSGQFREISGASESTASQAPLMPAQGLSGFVLSQKFYQKRLYSGISLVNPAPNRRPCVRIMPSHSAVHAHYHRVLF